MATYLPFSDVIAAYGYRQPPPVAQRANVFMLALAYVFMGGSLGTVAGIGLAMATLHTGIPAMVFQVAPAVQASSTADSAVKPVAPTSELTSRAAPASAVMAKPSVLNLTKASFHVTQPQRNADQPRSALKRSALLIVSRPIATSTIQIPATAPATGAAAAPEATNYQFLSEGDVTVADFDASEGRIETYEGRTFLIGAAAAASAGAAFEDSGTSVHYRCDQSGNCTLIQSGLVLQHVTLLETNLSNL